MRLKLYCTRYGHFKDALVCSVNCLYRTRCQEFALFYDEHRAGVDALVGDYYAARRAPEAAPSPQKSARASLPVIASVPNLRRVATAVDVRELISLEVKREMAAAAYIWIDKEGRAELLETEEVLRRAARGHKPQTIYKVAQEMELRFQLVPRKRIDKAKRTAAAEAARTTARRTRQVGGKQSSTAYDPDDAPTPLQAAPDNVSPMPPRRTRRRIA